MIYVYYKLIILYNNFFSVIYDNYITEQFVNTLKKLMTISPRKTAYIGMEKRYLI